MLDCQCIKNIDTNYNSWINFFGSFRTNQHSWHIINSYCLAIEVLRYSVSYFLPYVWEVSIWLVKLNAVHYVITRVVIGPHFGLFNLLIERKEGVTRRTILKIVVSLIRYPKTFVLQRDRAIILTITLFPIYVFYFYVFFLLHKTFTADCSNIVPVKTSLTV